MTDTTDTRSYLVKMKICNLGCIGPEGIEVLLDEIVCLVGANNSGKSTVLRAYEAAATNAELRPDEVFCKDPDKHPDFVKQPPTVELWMHMPKGTANVGEEWKMPSGDMLLVQSRWTWPTTGGKPDRETWDPKAGDYSTDKNASGLDTVFCSRLPRPFRIGSLDDPEEEHKKLLELVLEPIKSQLTRLMREDGSVLRERVKDLQAEAEKHVAPFRSILDGIQEKVSASYRRVFSTSEIRLSVSLGDISVDPGAALLRSSHVGIVEAHGQTRWSQQGTGSQRALFWSMLEVRSELNRIAEQRKNMEKVAKGKESEIRKKEEQLAGLTQESAKARKREEIANLKAELDALRPGGVPDDVLASSSFSPGYMLLIDEPETALHPAAIRAAKEYLYSLAAESGWQVMLSTHHPAFIDPLKDHTTIVRLHRPERNAAPNIYRSDTATFTADEKETLKTLLAFDQSVAEMFFSNHVIIVEGDTEFAAFTVAMDADLATFPLDQRPLLLRARGKWTIPLLVRMLAHFKVSCSVLHDVDAPKTKNGSANGAYRANAEICAVVGLARKDGVHVVHRLSQPNFEVAHKMDLPPKNKPFSAWRAVKNDSAILASVRQVLDSLCESPSADAANHVDDGQHYEVKCKAWALANAAEDPEFTFDD